MALLLAHTLDIEDVEELVVQDDFNAEARLSRLSKIHNLRALMQYEAKPNVASVRFDALGKRSLDDDAFSMSLKTLVETLCHQKQIPSERCSPGERHTGTEHRS